MTKETGFNIDPSWKGVIKWGGLSLFAAGGLLVIAAGILTLFSPFGVIVGVPIIIPFIGLVLTAVWQLVVGTKLYKLGQEV